MSGWKIEPSGNFLINNTSILNSTTLGTSVVTSSLTSIGDLTDLTVGTTNFKVLSTGNVGIGTTPHGTYKVNVNGDINFTGSLRRGGVLISPSPKDFGAVGDGITNDNTAFQAAINSGVKELVLRHNEVYVVSSLTISNDIEIKGPKTAKIFWIGGTTGVVASMINITGAPTVKFYGITIDCNRQGHTDVSGYFSAVKAAAFGNGGILEFDSVNFINGRINDITVIGPSTTPNTCRLSIRNCKFLNGLLSTNASTRSCQCVSVTDGVDLVASDNLFSCDSPDGTTTFGRAGICHQRVSGSTSTAWGSFYASGNKFINMGITPFTIGCLYSYSGARSVRYIGNVADSPFGCAFTAKADTGEIIMVGNTVNNQRGINDFGFGIYGSTVTAAPTIGKGMVIANNVVNTAEGNAYTIRGEIPTATDDFTGAIFTDNVASSARFGLRLQNCKNVSFTNFICQDCTTAVGSFEVLEGVVSFSGFIVTGGASGFRFTPSLSTDLTLADIKISETDISGVSGVSIDFISNTSVPQTFSIENNDIYLTVNSSTAIKTFGSVGSGSIRSNRIRVASGVTGTTIWNRSGTYGSNIWYNNESPDISDRNITVTSNTATVFADYHTVTASGSTATLSILNGGTPGQIVTLTPASGKTITVQGGSATNPAIRLAGGGTSTFVLDNVSDTLTLLRRATDWVELARSNNG